MIAPSQGLENARRARVERRWPRHQWDAEGRSRWLGWDWSRYLQLEICCFLFSSLIVEAGLWKNGEKQPWPLLHLLSGSFNGIAVLVLLIFTNGWLLDRGLADRTPGESLVPAWLGWLRRAGLSVPVAGLYVIPLWRWVLQTQPAWAFRIPNRSLNLTAPFTAPRSFRSHLQAWGSSLRRSQSQSFISLSLWMIAGQILPWLALLSWATTAEALSPGRRMVLIGLSTLCHLLACACGLQYSVIRGRQIRAARWKVVALRIAPLSFLFPFPAFAVGILLWVVSAGEDEQTLTSRSHFNKSRPPLPIPFGTRSSIARLFGLLSRGKREMDVILNDLLPGTLPSSVKEHQLAFYRLKAFLLLFDAAALAWVLTKFMNRPVLRLDVFPWLQITPFLCLAALGVMAELAFLTLRVVGWLLRRGLPYQPYGRSVVVTQLALAAGLLFGTLLAAGYTPTAGHLLIVIGVGAAIGSTLILSPISFLLMLPGRQILSLLAWAALFFELFLTGAVMYSQPELAQPFAGLFKVAITLTPVWSLSLFLGLRGWLLHPFRLRDMFDRRLPENVRATLAAIALTAAVPLGGIVIPFWIYAHHRLWPRYEKLLWDVKVRSTIWR
jgi:hypothetical protein